MNTLLVTGGAGFIGANFILYWLSHHPNDRIINLDLLTYAGNLGNLKSVENNPRYRFVQGDIRDVKIVDQLMSETEIVVHFAAETHVDRSILRPAPFITTNVVGTQVLLDAALKHQIKRFHHVSTDEVFGSLKLNSSTKFTLDTPYQPRSPYSASKAASDHLVRAYGATFDLPFTITNCSNNFGPYQFPEKLIPLAITNIIEDKPIPLYGDGLYVRDWLYVEDHVRGIELVINQGRVGETYLFGGQKDEEYSNRKVLELICQLMNTTDSSIEIVKDRLGHDRRYAVDWSKAEKDLGWRPRHQFKTWLKNTIKWYQEHQDWWREIKSGEYKNYYQKQYQK